MASPTSTQPTEDEKEQQDNKYNPAEQAQREKTGAGYVSGGANQTNDQASASSEDIRDKEEAGSDEPDGDWDQKYGSSPLKVPKLGIKTILKGRRGATIGIILVLIGVPIGGIAFLSPALLLEQIKNTLVGALDDGNAARTIRGNKVLVKKVNGINNAFTESSDGKCNIKCRFGSASDGLIKKFERAGFKVEVETRFNRNVIKSLTFPDGHTVTNGADFDKALDDHGRASSFLKAVNFKVGPFLASKFINYLSSRGLNKNPKLAGSTKAEVIAAQRRSLNLEGETAELDPLNGVTDPDKIIKSPRFAKLDTAITSAGAKAGALDNKSNAAAAGCTAYDVGRGLTYADKVMKISIIASFAMGMLTSMDQTLAGDIDPAAFELLMNMLTETVDGKSATSSPVYKMKSDGDIINPSAEDLKYSTSPTGITSAVAGLTAWIGANASVQGLSSRTCSLAYNPVIGVAIACGPEIAAALTTALETAGVGAVVSAAVCAATNVGAGIFVSMLLGQVLGAVVKDIVTKDVPNLDENTRGAPVLTAFTNGLADILGGKSLSDGLRPGTPEQIKEYTKVAAGVISEQEDIARYDARKEPFNINNQYSFMGSIVRDLGVANLYGGSLLDGLKMASSIFPASVSTLLGSATRATDGLTLSEKRANEYSETNCIDPNIQALGVGGDSSCNLYHIMTDAELNADIDSVIDNLVSSGNIDEMTGLPKEGSEFKKFTTYCSGRIDPFGETGASVAEDDYAWRIGSACLTESTQMSNFRTYTMDYGMNEMADEDDSEIKSTAMFYDSRQSSNQDSIASESDNAPSNFFLDLFSNIGELFSVVRSPKLSVGIGNLPWTATRL